MKSMAQSKSWRLAGVLMAAAVVSLVPCAAALAGEVPRLSKGNEGWVGVVIAVVLAVAVGVASFINPKRSHRD